MVRSRSDHAVAFANYYMNDSILVNPFGMAIEDVALATRAYQQARELKLGMWLDR